MPFCDGTNGRTHGNRFPPGRHHSPPMSLVALEAPLVSILPFSVDLQSADGKVLLGASGEAFS
jgi:hypothetical protein